MIQYVYDFDHGDRSHKSLFGGKGANLAEMKKLKIPVPDGFTITTTACNDFLLNNAEFPKNLWNQVLEQVRVLETKTSKTFGGKNPLLVSVRSGAAVSMPGMMDTVLNLGLNDETVKILANKTGNEVFAYDSYRRFIQMFSNVVLGIGHHFFEEILNTQKTEKNLTHDTELSAEDWKIVIKNYKTLVKNEKRFEFPQDPLLQLESAVKAVFYSWNNPRAIKYRKIAHIPDNIGTAVNVQEMVFGNLGETSGTGVLFSRNPSTGEKKLFGEFLFNAQGEDVVAGIRTPKEIAVLKDEMPKMYELLEKITYDLEQHFGDMQDIEFTIEQEKLFILQTRNAKRSAAAAVKIAVDMVAEGLTTKEKALLNIDPNSLNQLMHPCLKDVSHLKLLAKGLPASPGSAVGKAVFNSNEAEKLKEKGEKVILIRHETSPEDINGMYSAEGILTACGGMTSHAAVVARGMGKPCVSGVSDLHVLVDSAKVHDLVINTGDMITINGSTGELFLGEAETERPNLEGDFKTILSWADEYGNLHVRTNADTPQDAKRAREFGAKGIGLCRTEHMFFEGERIEAMREMILSSTKEQREKALAKLLPFQEADFYKIFETMDGYPVNIRLLDPPLHEFLPHTEADCKKLAQNLNMSLADLKEQIQALHEVNPMLGHRGCRLMLTYPEIATMQTRAIMSAASKAKKNGIDVRPEIMVPFVGVKEELRRLKQLMEAEIQEVFEAENIMVSYQLGTMIELPRACLVADEIAESADYFSFGTNDLTQMTYGYSRDDAGKFLLPYLDEKIIASDPFQTLDTEGVGKLMRIAVDKARKTKPNLKIGICGEHGGDPASIDFCFHQDFNYVSCSPFRVPIARLAKAQSFIKKWNI